MFENLIIRNRRLIVLSIHLSLIIVSNVVAFLLRFEWTIPKEYFTMIGTTLPLIILIRTSIFYYYGIQNGSWRYASIRDLLNIVKAVSLSSVLLVLIIYFFLGFHEYPRSIYVLDWLILTMLMGGIRVQPRIFREMKPLNVGEGKRVLLMGAGDAGEMILREIKQNPKLPYLPAGFIDDDPRKRGLKIHGVPVLGNRKDITAIAKRLKIEEIIIAISSASAAEMQRIVEDCKRTGLNLKIIPSIGNILNGHLSASQIREVRIEDLLYRDVVKIDTTHIGSYLAGKGIMVTGAAGSIGSELCRQIAKYNPKNVILFDQAESSLYFAELELSDNYPGVNFVPIVGDLQDVRRVKEVMSRYVPEIVFHSAAYKHVPLLEQNPSEAVKNNILVTRNLALVARDSGVDRFVLISTDKAVNPTSVMGATKRVAELYIQELGKQDRARFVIVRFGNVLGSNGSVIPLFKRQIEKRGPVTVTHPEVKRYFMTISEAVQLVLQASMMGNKSGEIFVLDMGEQVKILDLARHMITLSGYVPDQDVKIIFTGLRPGEKMSEELFDSLERVEDTDHSKIKKALSDNSRSSGQLEKDIQELEDLLNAGDPLRILSKLRQIVPTYQVVPASVPRASSVACL